MKRPLDRALLPSPWMLLVLSVWWAWRYAALPGGPDRSDPAVLAGFAVGALTWYALFGAVRWWRLQVEPLPSATARAAPRSWLALPLFPIAASSLARALDALQSSLSGHRLDRRLLEVLAENPLRWLMELRGLGLAVMVSVGVALWALHRDAALGRRLVARDERLMRWVAATAAGAALLAIALATRVQAPIADSAEAALASALLTAGGSLVHR